MSESTNRSDYRAHPRRIQRKRTKGWKSPVDAVSMSRPGPWGNPFRVEVCLEVGYAETVDDARLVCVNAFEDWLRLGDLSEWWCPTDELIRRWFWMRSNLWMLGTRAGMCWCPLDRPCHADVLLRASDVAGPDFFSYVDSSVVGVAGRNREG